MKYLLIFLLTFGCSPNINLGAGDLNLEEELDVSKYLPDTNEVYLLGGQENMQGHGQISEVSETYKESVSNVRIWRDGKFKVYNPKAQEHFGPELGFIRTLAFLYPYKTFYIVKYSDPDGGLYCGGSFFPGRVSVDPDKGKAYTEMFKTFQNALVALSKNGVSFTIEGFIWVQGEADAQHLDTALNYYKHFALLNVRLHRDLQLNRVIPVIYSEILSKDLSIGRAVISQTQKRMDHNSETDVSILNAWLVETDNFSLESNLNYLDTQGQIMLGVQLGLTSIKANSPTKY
jgi:hypothetical protein